MPPKNNMRPIHPGEFLREDFLIPLDLTASDLGRALKVPINRITGILNEKRSLTADTAIRLARYFGTTPDFWMTMQTRFDLRTAEQASGREIASDVKPRSVKKAG